MPNFERITDSLKIHVARTPEKKAYAKGFVDGKSKARKEVMFLAFTAIFLKAAISFYFGAPL